jgi:hypothetical protein
MAILNDRSLLPYQQQGLLQIFEDFCLADTTNCVGCQFPKMIAKLG